MTALTRAITTVAASAAILLTAACHQNPAERHEADQMGGESGIALEKRPDAASWRMRQVVGRWRRQGPDSNLVLDVTSDQGFVLAERRRGGIPGLDVIGAQATGRTSWTDRGYLNGKAGAGRAPLGIGGWTASFPSAKRMRLHDDRGRTFEMELVGPLDI